VDYVCKSGCSGIDGIILDLLLLDSVWYKSEVHIGIIIRGFWQDLVRQSLCLGRVQFVSVLWPFTCLPLSCLLPIPATT
jgi:hypothetical protein